MLVLTRKLQEKIQIGDGITITVLRTKGKSVRLGIEAPMEVPVIRGELVFGHAAEAPHEEEEVGAAMVATSVDAGRGVAKAARTMPTWDADYLPADRLPGTVKQVSLQRVPRAQVAQAIAAPVHAGPLRAMLERRSLTA